MNLCVTTKLLRQRDGEPVPFGEMLSLMKAAGFSEMDYCFRVPGLLLPDWRENFRAQLRQAADRGIRLRYVHLPYDYPKGEGSWEDFRLATFRAMELAVEGGADCAAIHPRAILTRDYDPEREYAASVDFLTPYREEAGRQGLRLALENMRGPGQSRKHELFRFGSETAEIIRLADEMEMGVCWDTGHGNISGQDPRTSLAAVGKRLCLVHIDDNCEEDDIHLAPFLGTVDWQGVVEGLRAAGYSGSLNLEVSCDKRPGSTQTAYAMYLGEAARHLADMLENTKA